MNQPDEKKKYLKKDLEQDPENEDKALSPDPETLHKTDPQDNMKGPISSLVNKVAETVQKNDKEVPEDEK